MLPLGKRLRNFSFSFRHNSAFAFSPSSSKLPISLKQTPLFALPKTLVFRKFSHGVNGLPRDSDHGTDELHKRIVPEELCTWKTTALATELSNEQFDKVKEMRNDFVPGSVVTIKKPIPLEPCFFTSLMEQVFMGNREYFKGTDLYDMRHVDWREYPILKLTYRNMYIGSAEDFSISINNWIKYMAEAYKIELPSDSSLPVMTRMKNFFSSSSHTQFLLDKLLLGLSKFGTAGKYVVLIEDFELVYRPASSDKRMREILFKFHDKLLLNPNLYFGVLSGHVQFPSAKSKRK